MSFPVGKNDHLKGCMYVEHSQIFRGFFIHLEMHQVHNKDLTIQTLNSHRTELVGFGVERIGLFGSYNKDKMGAESDIDFLVETQKDKKTFRSFMSFEQANKLRNDLGIRTVELHNQLLEIQETTGMGFYLEGRGWIKRKYRYQNRQSASAEHCNDAQQERAGERYGL